LVSACGWNRADAPPVSPKNPPFISRESALEGDGQAEPMFS
jgi:hypothetical protein